MHTCSLSKPCKPCKPCKPLQWSKLTARHCNWAAGPAEPTIEPTVRSDPQLSKSPSNMEMGFKFEPTVLMVKVCLPIKEWKTLKSNRSRSRKINKLGEQENTCDPCHQIHHKTIYRYIKHVPYLSAQVIVASAKDQHFKRKPLFWEARSKQNLGLPGCWQAAGEANAFLRANPPPTLLPTLDGL